MRREVGAGCKRLVMTPLKDLSLLCVWWSMSLNGGM